ncbi:PREDICTED: uncharacterized protein LOC105365693 [Ceratosolen solmsi marchali]|uniref:Uncharacterized protein LOC105365693 n=1 Tax=Ceratosolen solmsi marchali TaxID=326594 RepID=A0AAJ6YQ70_9HYME|nr:PREDICTED: uncharacterized protein LOC105365693 [Ceratosolen solmsi marchali]
MNINAIPFIAGNNQGLASQIPELPSAAFNVFPDEQQQICMNEISNSSQNLLSLHNTVCNLSKQLASAQANLLAAQVKFYQDAVSCSTNTHNQLPTQSQNLSITDVHSAKYSTLPTIQSPMPNIQKNQNDSYALHKNFPTHNVQDFGPPSYQANATIEPRLDLQPMYIQQNHFHHQQQHPNFQQYYLNTQPTNSVLRGKVQGSIEDCRLVLEDCSL